MFYMSAIFCKPRISVKRKFKRTIVVLKSPFHYKSPKHHIQYSYLVIHASVSVKYEYAVLARRALSTFFIQNKPNRVQIKTPLSFYTSGLL